MTYSFTKPVSKHVLKPATKIWAFYFVVAFAILFYFRIHLIEQTDESKALQDSMKAQQDKIVKSTNDVVEESKRLYYELGVTTKVKERDLKLRMQIENILAMIPDNVVVEEIRFTNNSLYMKGQTISQELFETSMQGQLRAIYSSSNASFYQLPSGWYNFESISKTTDGLEDRVDTIN